MSKIRRAIPKNKMANKILIENENNKIYYVFPEITSQYFDYIIFKLEKYKNLSRKQWKNKIVGVILPVYCFTCRRYLNLGETYLKFKDGTLKLVCRYCGTTLEKD